MRVISPGTSNKQIKPAAFVIATYRMEEQANMQLKFHAF